MVELSVVCALSALALAFAFVGARALGARRVVGHSLAQAAGAVAAGVTRYLRRQYLVTTSLSALVAGVILVVYGVAYQVGGASLGSVREHGLVVTGAFAVGVVVTLFVGWASSSIGVQTAVRVAESARRSIDDALVVALKGGMVTGLIGQASGTLVSGLGVLALYGYFGGYRGDRSLALAEFARIPLMLSGLALGAAFVSFLGQIGGGIFGRVADLGAAVTGTLEAGLPEDARGNPATLAHLVGDQVGDATAHGMSGVASTLAEVVVSMMVAALVFQTDATFPSVTALVLCPLVVRAFGAVAGWFGAAVVRTDETEAPTAALHRGVYVTATLAAVATVGSSTWLLGAHAVRFAAAALLGIAASIVLLFVVEYFSGQRYHPVRALAETARSGASLATLRGLLVAADATLAGLVLLGAVLLGAYRLGISTGVRHGGMLGVAMALGGLRGTSAYVKAMAAMGTSADTASGILALATAAERPDVLVRARLLAAVGATAKSYNRVLQAVTTVVVSLMMMGVFREWVARAGRPAVELHSPPVLLGACLGIVVVVAFSRVLLGGIVAAGRELVQELRHRLDTADRTGRGLVDGLSAPEGLAQARSAEDACVEAVSRAALRGMLAPALVGVVAPMVVGVGLRLSSTGDSVPRSAEALVAYVIVATIAGGLGSLLFANAGSAWDNANRYIETGAHGGRHVRHRTLRPPPTSDLGASLGLSERVDVTVDLPTELNPAYEAALIGDTIGDPLKGAVAPAMLALIETLALLVMVFYPFFI